MPKKEPVITPASQAAGLLKTYAKDHYNYEDEQYYIIPSSSMKLNAALEGGIPPGAHRAMGVNSGGKTSCSLDFMYNFLSMNKLHHGIYFKCEGRLSPKLKERSGIEFTTDPDTWENNCLVVESNIYEAVFGMIKDLISDNSTGSKYFMIIDSMDNMVKRDDLAKDFTEAPKVAGGALLTSVFLKKVSLALSKRGHVLMFISQIRDKPKIDQYEKQSPRQGMSSGGHAVEHNSSVVLDFQERYQSDLIRENPNDKKSKIIGHVCKVVLVKTDNEKNQLKLGYPIKYGRVGGKSVWREMELCDMLLGWDLVKKSGAWLKFSDIMVQKLKESNIDAPEQFHGLNKLMSFLEERRDAADFIEKELQELL